MTDRILVSGIEVFAYHGVGEREKRDGQLFSIDVALETDLSAPGRSDDLADTVDYGHVTSRIHDLVATERWDLIERVAQRVAELVLEDQRVSAVEVTIHKPQAPIEIPFRDVAVAIRRQR